MNTAIEQLNHAAALIVPEIGAAGDGLRDVPGRAVSGEPGRAGGGAACGTAGAAWRSRRLGTAWLIWFNSTPLGRHGRAVRRRRPGLVRPRAVAHVRRHCWCCCCGTRSTTPTRPRPTPACSRSRGDQSRRRGERSGRAVPGAGTGEHSDLRDLCTSSAAIAARARRRSSISC